MGSVVSQLESPKFSPVNVVKSIPSPSSLIFSATTEGTVKVIDARLANYVYDLKVSNFCNSFISNFLYCALVY